jgi:hypothetical protein
MTGVVEEPCVCCLNNINKRIIIIFNSLYKLLKKESMKDQALPLSCSPLPLGCTYLPVKSVQVRQVASLADFQELRTGMGSLKRAVLMGDCIIVDNKPIKL